jgi:hypothetical protein
MAVPHAIRRFLPFLLLCFVLAWPAPGHAQIAAGISVDIAPPPLPVYAEPPLPEDGYIFMPGYWAWAPSGFYWVPGTWVLPPAPGLLWTPGYWAFIDGVYVWYAGYWGPTVGFYGGVDYGFGYYGSGYDGGYWQGGFFFYNGAVHNFGSVRVAHSYRKDVSDSHARTSFAGAPRGTSARPGPDETRAASEPHQPPHALQVQHETQAATIRTAPATVNHGRPPVAATQRPATFTGPGITSAARPAPAAHPAGGAPPGAPHPAPAPHPAGGAPPAGHSGGGAPPENHGGEPEHH